MNLTEYLAMETMEKFNLFMDTRFMTNRTPRYWVNWDNVTSNMLSHELNLNTLNFLIGKDNIKQVATKLFSDQPNLLKSMPIIIASRDSDFDVLSISDNGDMSSYELDFDNPDNSKISDYVDFLEATGLLDFLQNDLKESLVDFVYGVQVGLDSNGRKNRSGTQNEKILEINLKALTKNDPNLEFLTQATASKIYEQWGITVPESLDSSMRGGRRYDGAVYNINRNTVTVIETNFYGGGGSKLKAVAGEFSSIYSDSLRDADNVDFVWISDGKGWDTARNPLAEAFAIIPNIFNLNMVKQHFLRDLVQPNRKDTAK